MFQSRASRFSPLAVAIVALIGCGGGPPAGAANEGRAGKPQAAAATSDRPIQLAADTPAAAQPAAAGSASVKGTVQFEGAALTAATIKMDADPVCQQQQTAPVKSEDVVVNSNQTLKNVFVYVKAGAKGAAAAPTTPVRLDQAGCWYHPHVQGIRVGQPLEIVNSDATLHNVNAKPAVNQPFNVAQPVQGMKTTKKFEKPEIMVKFKCNVHPWMSAYLGVVDNPFFGVTGDDGAFTLSGLPAGTYTLEAWHEKYGTQSASVTVGDGEAKSVTFTFKGQ